MNPMIDHLHDLLVQNLKAFTREVEAVPSDAALWAACPGVTNTVGNLALHVAGNLQFFVGGVLGGSGYVRDRDREFSQRSGTRAEVAQELERARQAVATVLPGLSEEDLRREFPFTLEGRRFPTDVFLLRLGQHLTYHLGQANYLRRLSA